jgi:RNA polymerase sigma-70 factor (ECF subfamily)
MKDVAMDERDQLAERFEEHRGHLRAVAYRMLGSLAEAEDAVQEAWIRLSRSDTSGVENLGGWLSTVVSRVCLDILRSRKARREESLDAPDVVRPEARADEADPEQEALLADSVGLALLVVMERLEPAERLAFVLHDMFAVPFDEIAAILDRTPAAARQLASRARRRVHGADGRKSPAGQAGARGSASSPAGRDRDRTQQRSVIDAFLAAARAGDLHAVLTVLDPEVSFRTDAPALLGGSQQVRGAGAVAPLAMRGRARAARPVLVNGAVGVVVAPRGHLLMVLDFTISDGKVIDIEAISDPARVAALDLAVLDE